MAGNVSGDNYLNVVLDTRALPESDHAFPSWGTITITSVLTDCADIANDAANLATTVVGGTYSWNGKGYTGFGPCESPGRFVSSQEILQGYNQYHAQVCPNPPLVCEFAPGLDCSGLIFWSYNKTVGATSPQNGFLQVEGSGGQCGSDVSDPIDESDLRAGDIACFPGHVAMYVEPVIFKMPLKLLIALPGLRGQHSNLCIIVARHGVV